MILGDFNCSFHRDSQVTYILNALEVPSKEFPFRPGVPLGSEFGYRHSLWFCSATRGKFTGLWQREGCPYANSGRLGLRMTGWADFFYLDLIRGLLLFTSPVLLVSTGTLLKNEISDVKSIWKSGKITNSLLGALK